MSTREESVAATPIRFTLNALARPNLEDSTPTSVGRDTVTDFQDMQETPSVWQLHQALPNRTLMDYRLHMACRESDQNSMLTGRSFIDPDCFKQINDTMDHLSQEANLRNAVARNELRLYYQPLVNVATGAITTAGQPSEQCSAGSCRYAIEGIEHAPATWPLASEMKIASHRKADAGDFGDMHIDPFVARVLK